jgi:hypothetical protein
VVILFTYLLYALLHQRLYHSSSRWSLGSCHQSATLATCSSILSIATLASAPLLQWGHCHHNSALLTTLLFPFHKNENWKILSKLLACNFRKSCTHVLASFGSPSPRLFGPAKECASSRQHHQRKHTLHGIQKPCSINEQQYSMEIRKSCSINEQQSNFRMPITVETG